MTSWILFILSRLGQKLKIVYVGEFEVKSFYRLLSNGGSKSFPWKFIWKVWILDWCFMCKRNGELVDHLFLHCPFAMDLWTMVLGLFGVSWVMPRTVLGLLGCWQGSFSRHRNGYIWSIIPHCLMWCLWRERNSRCFEDYENSIPDLKLLFFRTLRDWLFALQSQSFPSFIDFLD